MVKSFALSELDAECSRSLGLMPDELGEVETQFLLARIPDIQTQLHSYLCCRNFLIRVFAENSCEFVDINDCLPMEIKETSTDLLIAAHDFLDRYRYINYGLVKTPEIDEWLPIAPKRICVIGGGLTGIVAAREVHNLFTKSRIKTDIIVFERRQRIGGRYFTFPLSTNFRDIHQPCIELGAKNIYNRGRLSQIISQLGMEALKMPRYDRESFRLYDIDGSIIHRDLIIAAEEFLKGVIKHTPSKNVEEIDELLQKHELYPLLHDSHIRILQWLLAQMEANFDNAQEEECRITLPGGSSQIVHGLAYGLREDDNPFRILSGIEVKGLDFGNTDRVLVSTGSDEGIEVDAVILAISDNAVGNIKFSPQTGIPICKSTENRYSSDILGNRIILVFPRIFWPVTIENFGVLSSEATAEDRGEYFHIENLYKSTEIPCLRIDCSGYSSLEMEEKDDQTIIDEVLEKLSVMFPYECPLPYPIEHVITRWSMDNFSKSLKSIHSRSFDYSTADSRLIHSTAPKIATNDLEYSIENGMRLASKTANLLLPFST